MIVYQYGGSYDLQENRKRVESGGLYSKSGSGIIMYYSDRGGNGRMRER